MKNTIFPHKFWRPFLDCMPQLFFRPKYVWFPSHLKDQMIPDPSGQLAELIVLIISTRVDLYCHQILLTGLPFAWSPFYLHGLTLIIAWISNCNHYKVCDENIYTLPTSAMQPLNFGNGLVISSHSFLSMWLLIHAGFKLNHVCKRGPLWLTSLNKDYMFR